MESNNQILEAEIKSVDETIRQAEDNAAQIAGQILRLKIVRDALTKSLQESDDQLFMQFDQQDEQSPE
jgi:hypothetical protein